MAEDREAREARELARARATLAHVQALLSRPPVEPYTHIVRDKNGREFSIHKSQASADTSAALVKGTVHPWSPA